LPVLRQARNVVRHFKTTSVNEKKVGQKSFYQSNNQHKWKIIIDYTFDLLATLLLDKPKQATH